MKSERETYLEDDQDTRWSAPSVDLREPPAPKVQRPKCLLGDCAGKRNAAFRVSVLLYPLVPRAIGSMFTDRGARVTVGHVCKKHKHAWTVASFLASPQWAMHERQFRYDFDSRPDPAVSQLEVVRI